jgi:lupus La protein
MEQELIPKKSKSTPKAEPSQKALQTRAINQAVAQKLKLVDANIISNLTDLLVKSVASASKIQTANAIHNGIAPMMQPQVVRSTAANSLMQIPITPLIEAIRKQLEFYFGDPNLSRDKYMQTLITKHQKGYVELKDLLGFKKIQHFLSTANIQNCEERISIMRSAIKTSQLLKMCRRGLMVKRAIPFQLEALKNPEIQTETDQRVIYIENLPSNCTQEILAEIFKPFGIIVYISLPKSVVKTQGTLSFKQSKCKGYAFIEFGDSESANAALSANNSIPEKFINSGVQEPLQPLTVMSKHKWNELKQQFKLLSKRPPAPRSTDFEQENGGIDNTELKEGTLLRVKNLPVEGVTKKDLKAFLEAHTTQCKYIDYPPGKQEATIRFSSQSARDSLRANLNSAICLKNLQLPLQLVSLDEESEYFKKVEKKRDHFRSKKRLQQSKSLPISPKSASARKPGRRPTSKPPTKTPK